MSKLIATLTVISLALFLSGGLVQSVAAQQTGQEGQFRTQVGQPVPVKMSPDLKVRGLAEKLSAALERTVSLSERATILVAKFETRGIALTQAKAAQEEAKKAIEAARQAVTKFQTQTLSQETPLKTLRATAKEVLQKVKQAHAAVVEVIRLIKAGKTAAEKQPAPAAETD